MAPSLVLLSVWLCGGLGSVLGAGVVDLDIDGDDHMLVGRGALESDLVEFLVGKSSADLVPFLKLSTH